MVLMSNNQFDILQAIRRKDYLYVWERTKYLGYQDVSDIEERYLLFRKAISIFNPDQNNNFISFYKRYMVNNKIKNSTFYITDNKNIIKELKNNHISPETSEGKGRKYVLSQLEEWENDLE